MNIERGLLIAGGLYVAGYWMKTQSIKLRYFRPSEFGIWWPMMDKDLLLALDEFRHALGKPIIISPSSDSLGRAPSLKTPDSRHNYARWGKVMAADVMFPWMTDKSELEHAFEVAKDIRVFGGIGVYPDWGPYGYAFRFPAGAASRSCIMGGPR